MIYFYFFAGRFGITKTTGEEKMSFTILVKRSCGRDEYYIAGTWFEVEKDGCHFISYEMNDLRQELRIYRGDKAYVMNELGNTVGKIEEKEDRQFVVNVGGEE